MTSLRYASRRSVVGALLVAGVAVLAAYLGSRVIDGRRTVTPVPLPVYEIESVSGNHHASVLNLPVGQPGVVQVPTPVDVDGDLLPDVLVSVNLINVEGPLHDPPILDEVLGRTIAPNMVIDRLPTAIILGQPSPPLRINVKLTIRDLEGEEPDMIIRAGYDTGHGGSIPHFWRAVLTGLDTMFNPLTATIDTKGSTQGPDAIPVWYEGPLTIIFGLNQGDFDMKADLVYEPWPDAVAVRYESDDLGHHIDYRHGLFAGVNLRHGTVMNDVFQPHVPGTVPEVDLLTKLRVVDTGSDLAIDARVDRLPRVIDVDYHATADGGEIDYQAKADGRLPDVDIHLSNHTSGETPTALNADVKIEALPPEVHARWSIPEDGPVSALFSTNDPEDPVEAPARSPGVGAVEASVTNYDGPATLFTPFVPDEQQFFNMQSRTKPDGTVERLITARIEKIRRFTFDEVEGGFDTRVNMGDGVLPLQANIETDALENGDILAAEAVMAPLPDDISVELRRGSKDDLDDPFRITYESSQTVDVDAHVEVRKPDAEDAICGAPDTLCADIDVRDLPTFLETRIGEEGEGVGAETRVEVDLTPRTGAVHPDIALHAIAGKKQADVDPAIPADDPVPLVAEASIIDLPDHLRMRMVEGEDETIEKVDFQTCIPVELIDRVCEAGTEGEIGEISFAIRNFLEGKRPAGLPRSSSTAPLFADVSALGLDNTTATVRMEAAGRVTDVEEVRFVNLEGIFALRTILGAGQDLESTVDIRNVDFEDDDPANGRTDIQGSALVTPLPARFDACFRKSGYPLDTIADLPFSEACESDDPFGDGSVDETPMTFAYRASQSFGVAGGFELTTHGDPLDPADEHATEASFDFDVLPDEFTASVVVPPEEAVDEQDGSGVTRIRTEGSAVIDRAAFGFEDRFGGGDCNEPHPAGNVLCVDTVITGFPEHLSAFIDTSTTGQTKALFYACDADFEAADPADACLLDEGGASTEGEIGQVEARFRGVKGSPQDTPGTPAIFELTDWLLTAHRSPLVAEHPFALAPADLRQPYVLAFALVQPTEDDSEMLATALLTEIRSVTFDQSADGFDVRTDLGDGVRPLLAHVFMDNRPGTVAEPGKQIIADARIDPLPQVITVSQHGPGEDELAEPLAISYTSTSPVTVDALAEIRDVGASDTCGFHGTVCAGLRIVRLPTDIEARISQFDVPGDANPGDDVSRKMSVELDALPFDGVALPDITADATLGQEDDTPIVAHAELFQFPKYMRLLMSQTGELQNDDSLADESMDALNFMVCDLVDEIATPPVCITSPTNTEGEIGEVQLQVRNFLVRPLDFPVPVRIDRPDSLDPLYAGIALRGDRFEATAGLTSIRQLRLVNRDGLVGVRTAAGDLQPFTANADFAGLSLGDLELGDDLTFFGATLRLKGEVSLSTLPDTFDVCFRESGLTPFPPEGTDFTQPCEDTDPFQDGVTPPKTPLSIAYRAHDPITLITTDVDATIAGNDRIPIFCHPLLGCIFILVPRADTRNIKGNVDIHDLPKHLTAHVNMPDTDRPRGQQGPLHALFYYDDVTPTPPPIDIEFGAEYTVGTSVCDDLRLGKSAKCISGELKNLPSRADVFVEPDSPLADADGNEIQNLHVHTNGTQPMNLENIKVSSIDPGDNPGDANKVMIIDGDIFGLPNTVDGVIHMPDEDREFDGPAVDITSDGIDHIDVRVRNFVAPDPMPTTILDRDGVPAEDELVTMYMRGEKFKATFDVHNLLGGAFKNTRNAAGDALGGNILRVDFGVPPGGPFDRTIRAYIDMESLEDKDDPLSTQKIFADVTLDQVPAGIDVCFRPKLPVDDPLVPGIDIPGPDDQVPVPPSPCDIIPGLDGVDDEGAFQFKGRPGASLANMDIYGLFRMAKKGGSDVLAAIFDVLNVPQVVQGTFGDGTAEVASFEQNGTTPDGIDDVKMELANFDLPDYGYEDTLGNAALPPWGNGFPGDLDPLPADPGHEYGFVAANNVYLHVRAHIGTAKNGSDGARPTHFLFNKNPCGSPTPGNPPPGFYPKYPLDNPATPLVNEAPADYKCIRGDFEAASPHPLLFDAVVDKDGKRFAVKNGGLLSVPQYFQITLAEAKNSGLGTLHDPVTNEDVPDSLLPRCGTEANPHPDQTKCVPPLVHFDSTGNSMLWGTVEYGGAGDVATLRNQSPLRTMADLNATPVPTSVSEAATDGWADWGGAGARGARLKMGQFPGDRLAVIAQARIDIPTALTIDQVQTWDHAEKTVDPNFFEAKDIRFHYAFRGAGGGIQPAIGELAGMIHDFSNGGETLIANQTDFTRGLPIPGELGVDIFVRDDKGHGLKTYQIDGRLSTELGASLRLIQGSGDAAIGDVNAELAGVPPDPDLNAGDPNEPSYRLRIEMKTPAQKINPPAADPDADWKEALLCIVYCLATDVGKPDIDAFLDLSPNNNAPARLLEAVVNELETTKRGDQIHGYRNIDGSGGGANFNADINIDINPFNMFLHVGVPVLLSFDMFILGALNVHLDMPTTSDFQLRENLLHLDLESASGVGDMEITHFGVLTGILFSIFGIFLGNPILYGISAGPIIPFFFYFCPTPVYASPLPNVLLAGIDYPLGVSAWLPFFGPFPVPPVFTYGSLKVIFDAILGLVVPPVLCAWSTDDIGLITSTPSSATFRHPGDSLFISGHRLPGLGQTEDPSLSTTPPAQQPALDLHVLSGQNLAVCGDQSFNNVTVDAGGTLTVSNVAANSTLTPPHIDDCPANRPDDPTPIDHDGDPGTPPVNVDDSFVNLGRLNLTAQKEMTINGTVTAVTAPGALSLTGGEKVEINGTVNAGPGKVTITGDLVEVTGTVDADAVATGGVPFPFNIFPFTLFVSPLTNNGGAGHGGNFLFGSGDGGDGLEQGTVGVGGSQYGNPNLDASTSEIPIEPGSRGGNAAGGAQGGNGGGTISVIGREVHVDGTLTADGDPGGPSTSGNCAFDEFVPNPTPPPPVIVVHHDNDGAGGGGGGSGGGIVVAGEKMFFDTPDISAAGGAGGAGKGGWGGGGAGGSIKFVGGLYSTPSVNVSGAAGGSLSCPGDFTYDAAAAQGENGNVFEGHFPLSRALGTEQFWRRGADTHINYSSVAPLGLNGENDYVVILCGIRKPPEALLDSSDNFGLVMPTETNSWDNPCGTTFDDADPAEDEPTLLGLFDAQNTTETPVGATIHATLNNGGGALHEGVWGMYTVIMKNDGVDFNNDCLNPFDTVPFPASVQYDRDHCLFEAQPASPDTTIGVDNTVPTFDVSAATATSSEIQILFVTITVPVTAVPAVSIDITNEAEALTRADGMGVVANTSGIDFYACRNDFTGPYYFCNPTNLKISWQLPDTEGIHSVEVWAQDQAGNQSALETVYFLLDSVKPSSATATMAGGTAGDNNWFETAPTSYTLSGFTDVGPPAPFPGVGSTASGPAAEPWEYRFDTADWKKCADLVCVITSADTPLPDTGQHRLQWRAIDNAGNKEDIRSIDVLIDGKVPVTAIANVPDPPPGQWALVRPLVVTAADDQFGHSGVDPTFDPDLSDLCDGVSGPDPNPSGTCVQIDGGGFVPYTGTIELGPGVHNFCAYSVDVAGNTGLTVCKGPIFVDPDVPTGTATVAPPAPDGANGWYDTVPTVTFSNYDPTGSFEPAEGGFHYRVDNSLEFTCSDGCTVNPALLTDGEHTVFWTVEDSAGHRRAEQAIELDVDTHAPRTYVLPAAPTPDGSNGWYHHLPWVTLAAFDDLGVAPGSGIDHITYRINLDPPVIYSGPFQLDPGVNNICFAATDVAGNVEVDTVTNSTRCTIIKVDDEDPTTTLVQPGPDGLNGWYNFQPSVSLVANDTAPGSGVNPGFDSTADLCSHLPRPQNPNTPSGTCVSVDGSPFFVFTLPLTLSEGEHLIRSYSVDVSGRESEMIAEIVKVDQSDPQTTARTFPPDPAKGVWWRATPTMVLRAADGAQNGGVTRIEYRFGVAGPFTTYTGPFVVPEGVQTVQYRAYDGAGRVEPLRTQVLPVDVTNPTVRATNPTPAIWLRLFIPLLNFLIMSPTHATLNWWLSDNMTGTVHVRVLVYGTLHEVVRDIDGGFYNVTADTPLFGFTLWDGKNQALTGLVPVGIYHYRVMVTDGAGNVAMSGESKPVQIKLL